MGTRTQRPALASRLSVRAGRDAYLKENGFTIEAYDAKWTPASLLGIRFSVPNTAAHRQAIMWHDLHHVATGYGTDPAGEGEISAWELRRGLAGLDAYVSAIVVSGVVMGLLVAPRRTWRAFQAAERAGTNLFARALSEYDATLDLDIASLRRFLGVPEAGLAGSHRLHSTAPEPVGAAASDRGSISTARVPSAKARLRAMRTKPSGLCSMRWCAMGGRST